MGKIQNEASLADLRLESVPPKSLIFLNKTGLKNKKKFPPQGCGRAEMADVGAGQPGPVLRRHFLK